MYHIKFESYIPASFGVWLGHHMDTLKKFAKISDFELIEGMGK